MAPDPSIKYAAVLLSTWRRTFLRVSKHHDGHLMRGRAKHPRGVASAALFERLNKRHAKVRPSLYERCISRAVESSELESAIRCEPPHVER